MLGEDPRGEWQAHACLRSGASLHRIAAIIATSRQGVDSSDSSITVGKFAYCLCLPPCQRPTVALVPTKAADGSNWLMKRFQRVMLAGPMNTTSCGCMANSLAKA